MENNKKKTHKCQTIEAAGLETDSVELAIQFPR